MKNKTIKLILSDNKLNLLQNRRIDLNNLKEPPCQLQTHDASNKDTINPEIIPSNNQDSEFPHNDSFNMSSISYNFEDIK